MTAWEKLRSYVKSYGRSKAMVNARVQAMGQSVEATPLQHEPGCVMVAEYAGGGVEIIAETVGYMEGPSWIFKGGRSWAAAGCRPATPEEEIEYWKKRAVDAEYALGDLE